ncbi:hypothetical protein [Photobacterium damselae]|uniref:hypothetical protein n=1 Tax=Photobacterium damselae TaxID=38293 RepID=UPI001F4559A6|nr:hypothetical protein [Photobacterium damselae]UKA03859.1 hypothetical protein IHC89_15130 [Photobacterium damselae subsp. damselae]
MGGRKSQEVPETTAQKTQAEVANKQWDLYENELKGFENKFIQRVDNFNSSSKMEKTKQTAGLSYASSFGHARKQLDQSMTANGVDPSSQKFQNAQANLSDDQGLELSDTVNRAQSSEQDKYLAGLQDVAAMGMGQKSDALGSIGDVANASLRKATSDAYDSFNRRAANNQLIGTVTGAGVSAGLRQLPSFKSASLDGASVDGVSIIKRLNTYNSNSNPNGTMIA